MVAPWILLLPLLAQIKVGGVEFLPKNTIFASADERSIATGSGTLPDGCRWELSVVTSVGQAMQEQPAKPPVDDCVAFYYRTVATLTRSCSDPQTPESSTSERTTFGGRDCPSAAWRPNYESRILSTGRNADGRRQEIVLQPDGTRVTVQTTPPGVDIILAYPDGSQDVLKLEGRAAAPVTVPADTPPPGR